MLQISHGSCSKCNVNATGTMTRQGKTTDLKNKSAQLSHSKCFLHLHFFTAPIFHYQAKYLFLCIFKSSFVVNSLIVKRKRQALSKMLLQSLVFQKALIQQQPIDSQLWRLEFKFSFHKWFFYNFCNEHFVSN